MKRIIACFMAALTLVLCFAGCTITDFGGNNNATEPTEPTEVAVELPDDFKNMKNVILATLVGMEKTEINYNDVKDGVSWELMLYLLKSNAKLSKSTNNYGNGSMIIPDAYTKEFAAAMFASYDGISSLPKLPKSFDSKKIYYDKETGSYIIKKEGLGKRDIKIVSTVLNGQDKSEGYKLTVDYIDTSKESTIASYNVVVKPSVYRTGKPIFNYTVASITKIM